MGEQSTYGIPAHYPVVLVERLGGLFFDARRSCTEDSFVGRSGLYRGESLDRGEYTCLCVRLGWHALNMNRFLLVTAYLS